MNKKIKKIATMKEVILTQLLLLAYILILKGQKINLFFCAGIFIGITFSCLFESTVAKISSRKINKKIINTINEKH